MRKLIGLILIFLSLQVSATDYYIASNGDDNNAGTSIGAPWQTIAKVNNMFGTRSPGDNFLFRRGDTFYGVLLPSRSGTAGNPMTYGAYGTGDKPIITGFTDVISWSNLGSNIWQSSVNVSNLLDANFVSIGGADTHMGRTPNTGWYTVGAGTTYNTLVSSNLNASTINWTGADVVIRTAPYYIVRNPVLSASSNSLSMHPTAQGATSGDVTGRVGYGFFLENDARTLDVQNEWYFNSSTKRLRIYSTTMPTNIKISTLDTLVYMIARNYISFSNLQFTGSNRRAMYIGSCLNTTITDCDFKDHGLYAIWGGTTHGAVSRYLNVTGCTFKNIHMQAIDLQKEFSLPYIGYNNFDSCGMLVGMFKVPIYSGAYRWDGAYGAIRMVRVKNFVVEYNNITNVGYAAIWWNPGDSATGKGGNDGAVRVNNNFIDGFCNILMDGGGIYTWTDVIFTPSINTKIYKNIVLNGVGYNGGTTETDNIAHGIYLDDNSQFNVVEGNTVANCPYSGIYFHNAIDCKARLNTVYNNGIQILYSSFAFPQRRDSVSNNIFVSRLASQPIVEITTGQDDIRTSMFNILDTNYYGRPISELTKARAAFELTYPVGNFPHYTFNEYRTYINPKETHSFSSPKSIASTAELRFEYNATSAPVAVSLDYNYIDMKSVNYNGTITLQPYSSAVLIRNGPITGGTPTFDTYKINHDNIIH